MDPLMNHFLSRMRTKVDNSHNWNLSEDPQLIDLSWGKMTKHTCLRFIDVEDLRHNSDAHDGSWIYLNRSEERSLGSDSENSALSVKSRQRPTIKQEVTSPKNLHPFSIAALIGDKIDDRPLDSRSVPAMITSAYAPQYTSSPYKPLESEQCYDQLPAISPIRPPTVTGETYWCHACNALCLDQHDAAKHQLIHRLRGTRCSLKTAVFSLYGYVTRHKKFGDDRLQCGVCEKVVSTCFFTKHQRLNDGHFCDVCGHEFSTNSRLQDHMNVHSGSMPFKCRICDRKFTKRASFTQHMRYHRDHKSYPCSYCQKSFNTKYACAVHERLHAGDNPFRCEIPGCDRSFPQKIQLQLHEASHQS